MVWLVVWRTGGVPVVNRVTHQRTPQTARKGGFSNRRLLCPWPAYLDQRVRIT